MATAEEGGATTAATTTTTANSSYGGEGGAGGKFRRKPFRKPTTPYDRPTIALRGNDSWYRKLVDPASKLISYTARRFFGSVLQKRLPPPPPSQIPESNHVLSDGLPDAVLSEPAGGECSQPIRNSGRNEISDLEQLLKQKTFTRSEIDHLTELLHSRGEVSLRDDGKRNEETVSGFGSHQQIDRGPIEANRSKGDGPHGVVSSPISNSKVLGDGIASPTELAKSYMGSRPLNLSPSVLSNHSQVTREDTKVLNKMRIASKPVSMSLTTSTVVGSGSPENGYLTKPSSLRRSAIYNMSRSPYLKRTGINHNGYAGSAMPSTSLSIVGNSERSESKTMTLKRRSFVLDDQGGSVGPIRRIRQKSNLIVPGVPHTDRMGRNSDAILVSSKQKLPLIGDPTHVRRTEGSTDISTLSTSYAIVPYEYNDVEVAVTRLGNLERTASKDKSESKVVAVRQKSPFKLTSSMLQGQALRSMEDATYSELLMNVQDDHMFDINAGLLDARDFPPQEQGKAEENGPAETSALSDTYYPVINKDSAVSYEHSLVRDGTSDRVESASGLSQPQNRAAFRMSALEDYVDMDDDLPCNGLVSRPFSEGRAPLEAHFTDSKFTPPEAPKVLESTIQSELKSPLDLKSRKTNEVSSAASFGGGNGIITPASEEVTAAALPTVPLPSVAALDKPKEINNPPSLFSFGSKVADKFPSLMPESSSRAPESSSSLLDFSAPTSSLVKVVDPEKGGYLKPPAAEGTSGKLDTVSIAASNGPLVSGAPAVSLTAATSNNNTHQMSTAAPVIFTPSVSVSDYIPSGTGSISSTTSSGIMFGAAEAPKVSGEPAFKFGASPDPSAKVSDVSTTIIPAGDLKTKALADSSSGIPSSSSTKSVAFGAPSSGNMTSGLSSSINFPSAKGSQGSLFSNASKSFVPSVGTVLPGTSAQPFSLASQPTSNMNSGTSFVSSLSSSQCFSPIMSFGLNSSASSSDTGAVVSSSGPTSSLFSANPSPVSDGSAGSSSSFTTPSVFSFGFSSSSSSTNAIGSTGGASASGFSFGASSSGSATVTTSFFSSSSSSTSAGGSTCGAAPSVFSFGLSAPASASMSNAASSFSNGASSVFKFGGSSSASSSAINSVNSNTAPSNAFGSSLQAPTSSIFGSSPATGFSFGASATSSAPNNSAPVVFSSSTAPPSSSPFSFSSAPASVFSSPTPTLAQPVFGNPAPGFAASSPGNNYQMSAEDSMAEDPVQSAAPSVPVFGQTNISPAPGYMFGSSVSSQPNPFQFGGQQIQAVPQNPSMFQASSSVEFNAGGSFSLGSGGGDKSGRKFVKANRNKNRKK